MRSFRDLLLEAIETAFYLAHEALEIAADRVGVGDLPDAEAVDAEAERLAAECAPDADPEAEREPTTVEELMAMTAADAAQEGADGSDDEAPPAAGVSQIIGDASMARIYLDPKPLHPRPIEGAEVRAAVPVPIRTWQRLNALLWWGGGERERLNREGLRS